MTINLDSTETALAHKLGVGHLGARFIRGLKVGVMTQNVSDEAFRFRWHEQQQVQMRRAIMLRFCHANSSSGCANPCRFERILALRLTKYFSAESGVVPS